MMLVPFCVDAVLLVAVAGGGEWIGPLGAINDECFVDVITPIPSVKNVVTCVVDQIQ